MDIYNTPISKSYFYNMSPQDRAFFASQPFTNSRAIQNIGPYIRLADKAYTFLSKDPEVDLNYLEELRELDNGRFSNLQGTVSRLLQGFKTSR